MTEQSGHCFNDAVVVKGVDSHGRYLGEQKVRLQGPTSPHWFEKVERVALLTRIRFSKFVDSTEGASCGQNIWDARPQLFKEEASNADLGEYGIAGL